MQQTPPPSPYLETTWDLPLKEVRQGLLNPKEKKRGYLELYFAGFMEFADSPPSPAMSDDETEYPRWGKVTGTRDSRPSTATAEVPQSPETSTFSDTNESIIHPLSRRTATASTDNTNFSGYDSSERDLLPSTVPAKTSSRRLQRRNQESRTRIVSSRNGRVTKVYRRSYSSIRTRPMVVNSQLRLRCHSTSLAPKRTSLKGR
jgi:hypothetical protein